MSDPVFERLRLLRDQRPPTAFAAAEAVRRRGRQRQHRATVAAGTVALALAGTGTGVGWTLATGPPSPVHQWPSSPAPVTTSPPATGGPRTPPVSTPDTPQPTAIPANAYLRPGDVGPGWELLAETELFEGSDPWYWAEACPAYRRSSYASLDHQLSVGGAALTGPEPSLNVHEIIERYADGWGSRSLADVESVILLCGAAPPPSDTAPTTMAIVARGFAGDESLLIRREQFYYDDAGNIVTRPHGSFVAVVRVGDFVVTLMATENVVPDAKTLADRAAHRLP